MDTKSLAKSKRAHSLHHKKNPNPNQKLKAAAATSSVISPTKPVKQVSSNWDRYEDENDTITANQPQPTDTDVVLPKSKSKGADYAYLISEANSLNSTTLSSDIFLSLDDFLSDFGQGTESFFAVHGESLRLSIQNDSFYVEDKTSANYEASFLSLNMHALAKQLTNIDLPKRLFIEADLFPPEQHAEKVEDPKAYDHHEVTSSTKSSISMNPTVPNSNPESVAKLEAETELDMLLCSFDDVNLKEKSSSTSTKKEIVDFDIDSTLDDLLKETSTSSVLDQNNASQSQRVANTKLLDDFDSWLDTI